MTLRRIEHISNYTILKGYGITFLTTRQNKTCHLRKLDESKQYNLIYPSLFLYIIILL